MLFALGAIDSYGRLTMPIGIHMADAPVGPVLAKFLLVSENFGCAQEAATIAAYLSLQQDLFLPRPPTVDKKAYENARRRFAVREGDHLTILNVYEAYMKQRQAGSFCAKHYISSGVLQRMSDVRQHLLRYMRKAFAEPSRVATSVLQKTNQAPASFQKNRDLRHLYDEADPSVCLRKCLTAAFFTQAARAKSDGSYQSVREHAQLHVHPSSVLYNRVPEWVIYYDVVETDKPYMRCLTSVDPEWLSSYAYVIMLLLLLPTGC